MPGGAAWVRDAGHTKAFCEDAVPRGHHVFSHSEHEPVCADGGGDGGPGQPHGGGRYHHQGT